MPIKWKVTLRFLLCYFTVSAVAGLFTLSLGSMLAFWITPGYLPLVMVLNEISKVQGRQVLSDNVGILLGFILTLGILLLIGLGIGKQVEKGLAKRTKPS